MKRSLLFLVALVILFYLETVLSSKEDKRIGYILPLFTFTASLVLSALWADSFSILSFLSTVILLNIPTYILLLIHKRSRRIYENGYPKKNPKTKK